MKQSVQVGLFLLLFVAVGIATYLYTRPPQRTGHKSPPPFLVFAKDSLMVTPAKMENARQWSDFLIYYFTNTDTMLKYMYRAFGILDSVTVMKSFSLLKINCNFVPEQTKYIGDFFYEQPMPLMYFAYENKTIPCDLFTFVFIWQATENSFILKDIVKFSGTNIADDVVNNIKRKKQHQ